MRSLLLVVYLLIPKRPVDSGCPDQCSCNEWNAVTCISTNGMPYPIPNDTKVLLISNSDIDYISKSSFRGLAKLQRLNMDNASIRMIEFGSFDVLRETLVSLSLRYNYIVTVGKGGIQNLNFLRKLDLSFNRIRSIRADDFDCLQNLKMLHLNDNEIGYFDRDTFVFPTSLNFLNLSENKIRSIYPRTFYHLPKLTELDISGNLLV